VIPRMSNVNTDTTTFWSRARRVYKGPGEVCTRIKACVFSVCRWCAVWSVCRAALLLRSPEPSHPTRSCHVPALHYEGLRHHFAQSLNLQPGFGALWADVTLLSCVSGRAAGPGRKKGGEQEQFHTGRSSCTSCTSAPRSAIAWTVVVPKLLLCSSFLPFARPSPLVQWFKVVVYLGPDCTLLAMLRLGYEWWPFFSGTASQQALGRKSLTMLACWYETDERWWRRRRGGGVAHLHMHLVSMCSCEYGTRCMEGKSRKALSHSRYADGRKGQADCDAQRSRQRFRVGRAPPISADCARDGWSVQPVSLLREKGGGASATGRPGPSRSVVPFLVIVSCPGSSRHFSPKLLPRVSIQLVIRPSLLQGPAAEDPVDGRSSHAGGDGCGFVGGLQDCIAD
jgi:hypothetical protein